MSSRASKSKAKRKPKTVRAIKRARTVTAPGEGLKYPTRSMEAGPDDEPDQEEDPIIPDRWCY